MDLDMPVIRRSGEIPLTFKLFRQFFFGETQHGGAAVGTSERVSGGEKIRN